MAQILDVTDASFAQDVMQSEVPVLVDVWAEWCAPCRALAPTVKSIAEEYGDRIRVAKIDADANPSTAAQLSVTALPTLLFVKGGKVVGQLVGNQPKSKLVDQIDQLLG